MTIDDLPIAGAVPLSLQDLSQPPPAAPPPPEEEKPEWPATPPLHELFPGVEPCHPGFIRWLADQHAPLATAERVWAWCNVGCWLLSIAEAYLPAGLAHTPLRAKVTLAACACARHTLPLLGNSRQLGLEALRGAERWAETGRRAHARAAEAAFKALRKEVEFLERTQKLIPQNDPIMGDLAQRQLAMKAVLHATALPFTTEYDRTVWQASYAPMQAIGMENPNMGPFVNKQARLVKHHLPWSFIVKHRASPNGRHHGVASVGVTRRAAPR